MLGSSCPFGVLLCALLASLSTHLLVWAELRPGDVLNQKNWQEAKGLVPDLVLRRFQDGSYAAKVLAPADTLRWGSKFMAAAAANAGKFTVDADEALLDVATQTYPAFLYGYPFPHIDPADPHAATKVMYNFSYALMQPDDADRFSNLHWVNTTRVERQVEFQGQILFYGSRFSGPIPNPDATLRKLIVAGVAPYEVVGVVTLQWVYLDPKQWNSLWTFIPALNRVRRLNPANSSDRLFGSDLTHDDPYLFSGKVPYFTWSLVGVQNALVPYTVPNPKPLRPAPQGYWLESTEDFLQMGWQMGGWQGKPWWPTAYRLVQRPVWVVEAVPKDPKYAYGRQILWIDRELYIGYYKETYDREGRQWRMLLNSVSIGRTTDGEFSVAQPDLTLAVDEQRNRATVELPLEPGQRVAFNVGLSAELFTQSALMKRAK